MVPLGIGNETLFTIKNGLDLKVNFKGSESIIYFSMFVNNDRFQKLKTEYLFSMIRVNFYFHNLFLNNKLVHCRILVT